MSFKDDLAEEVRKIFHGPWTDETATAVPSPDVLLLNQNQGKVLCDAVVLYADLDGSTNMVDTQHWQFAAEIYKAYLRSAAKVVTRNGGTITAYDGDRIMAVYSGSYMNTNAVITALELNFAVEQIIRPAYAFYKSSFVLKHVVGIDRSQLAAVKIGVRGENDITWVGKAANYAAKLCAQNDMPIWITEAVYDRLNDEVKYDTKVSTGKNMWSWKYWPTVPKKIYGTTYHRKIA